MKREPSERAKALRKAVAGAANELTKAWERSEPSADAMTAMLTASDALDDYVAGLEAIRDAAQEVDEFHSLPSMPLRREEIEAAERLEGCHERLRAALSACADDGGEGGGA